MDNLHQVYLSLGSNIDAEKNLPKAIELLRKVGEIKAISSVWESKSVGFDGSNFLNACALFLTELQSSELKENIIRPIETALGRIRYADKNAPRTIDIDMVVFDETPLNIEFWNYAFVTVPLAELIPDFEHPIRREKIIRVAEQLQSGVLSVSKDQMWIVKREDIIIS